MVGAADHVQAFIWYSVAAERFPAGQDKDQAERERRTARGQLKPDQIAEAEKQIRDVLSR